MSYTELVCYKLKELKISNNIEDGGDMECLNKDYFSVTFHEEKNMAIASLTESVETKDVSEFFIELTLEGFFEIDGVKNDIQKDAAYRRCYEKMFPIAAQIIQDITVHCGVSDGMRIQPNSLKSHIGSEPEEKNAKIIDFPTEE